MSKQATSEERTLGWDVADIQEHVASLRELVGEEDQEFLTDTLEGETTFFDILDRALEIISLDRSMVEGLKIIISENTARKKRKEKRIERIRAFVELLMDRSGLDSIERPSCTLSLTTRKPTVIVEEESLIPSKYWKSPPPVIVKTELTKDAIARQKALAEAKGKDERQQVEKEFPPIPGIQISNGFNSLTIRNL